MVQAPKLFRRNHALGLVRILLRWRVQRPVRREVVRGRHCDRVPLCLCIRPDDGGPDGTETRESMGRVRQTNAQQVIANSTVITKIINKCMDGHAPTRKTSRFGKEKKENQGISYRKERRKERQKEMQQKCFCEKEREERNETNERKVFVFLSLDLLFFLFEFYSFFLLFSFFFLLKNKI